MIQFAGPALNLRIAISDKEYLHRRPAESVVETQGLGAAVGVKVRCSVR
jgi:hypothetical protein